VKLLVLLVAVASAVFGWSRLRAGRNEADLWHEATEPLADQQARTSSGT